MVPSFIRAVSLARNDASLRMRGMPCVALFIHVLRSLAASCSSCIELATQGALVRDVMGDTLVLRAIKGAGRGKLAR